MLRLTRPLLLALAAALASPFVAVGSTPPEQWRSKVDPWVLETGRERATEFLVFLDPAGHPFCLVRSTVSF